MQNVKYVCAGHFTSQGSWRHPDITVPTWEIIYITHGTAYLYEGEREFTVSEGDALLFAPGIKHGGTQDSPGKVSFLWIHIAFENKKEELRFSSNSHVIRSVKTTLIPTMARQILHISRNTAYPKEMSDKAAELLAMEYSVWASEKHSEESELINRIKEWVRINSKKRLTAKEVALEFGYNEDYLTRIFKKKNGSTLKTFIDGMRINALRTELLTTDTSLKKISSDFGFDDYKSFLKFFVYHEGITPTKLRESYYMTHKNNK